MDSPLQKVLVAGTIRDGATSVSNSIEKISEAFEGIAKVKWFVVESDSTDATVRVLDDIAKTKKDFRYISLGNLSLKHPKRTDRIANARNVYLKEFQNELDYLDCTHLVVADLDGVNNLISKTAIQSTFDLNARDVFTANQLGPYYDIWALRHDLWSPNDCWNELEFYKRWYRWPEYALQKSVLSRMIRIPRDADPIEVQSAFGGLAIYPRAAIMDATYVGLDKYGNELCEHVTFSENIRRNGFRIFINPRMINTKYTEISSQKKLRHRIKRVASYPIKMLGRIIKK